MTYIGHRDGDVRFVGTERPISEDLTILELPASLERLTLDEIIRDYRVEDGSLIPKVRERGRARIAIVGVYRVPCGIATYTHQLVDALRVLVADIHVFAERETGAPDDELVTHCWDRGQPLGELVAEVKAYAPDLVIVQHEYGNFPVARHWLAFASALADYHVVVTLHSVYAHKDKSIVEAACRDIVVHTVGARRVLVEVKQVGGRVTLIPHGCPPPNREPPLWNLYGSPHTMIQFGFGFPYKGWEHSVAIVARLKKDYPDVFFTGLMSERWPDVHVRHARELRRLARELDVSEHVGLVLGFQSDPVLDAYLRTNRVGIFPYREQGEHTVYGCSGAARECMAKGLPVVTSTVPLFEDLEGVVPRRNTVEGWADAVAEIFEHGGDLARQDAFLATRSWPIVARSYLDLLNDA